MKFKNFYNQTKTSSEGEEQDSVKDNVGWLN